MPPRNRVSAPTDRLYKAITILKQTTLTAPSKRVRSYGKRTGVQLPKPDNTLTQMDWLKMQQMQDLGEQEEEGDEEYEEEVKKPKRKRPKTTGDEPSATPQMHTQTISQIWSADPAQEEEEEQAVDQEFEKETKKRKSRRRKTAGDQPSRTPQFHTQTLTQLDRSFNSAKDEEDRSIFDISSSSQSVKPSKIVKKRSTRKATGVAATTPLAEKSPVRDMPPPQTPHRAIPREIPSSQSPGTPISLHSRESPPRRSPLNGLSINTPIPFAANPKRQGSPSELPILEIQNSSENGTLVSQLSRIPPTSSKRSSPAKGVRFALPDVEEEEEPATPSIEVESTPYSASQASRGRITRLEILDSDAESEEDVDEHESLSALTSQVIEEGHLEQEMKDESEDEDTTILKDNGNQQVETESCYGEIEADTQFEAERIIDSPRLSGITAAVQAMDNSESETFQERTQIMESQRLATQYMDNMAPRTATSDIFISLHPQHVMDILSRAKDHEMRAYSFPPTVCRVWIFETKPVSILKYMAEIGPPKRPGQIADERALGNAAFNKRTSTTSWTAYEILQLYELSDPLPLSKLIANAWLQEPPKKYTRVGPAVLDQLVANLKPPLFHFELDIRQSSSTDTQEAEAQLLSTMKQFTQLASSSQALSQPSSSQFIKPEIENHDPTLAPRPTTRMNGKMRPPPSQASTVDLSQAQTPRHQSAVEVVWESPTRPVPSSTPLRLPTPRASGSQTHGSATAVPYSMASSQLLTKSQLLPNSLLGEAVPGPPLFIQDSDGEEEIE